MALSSVLTPEKITRNKRATSKEAQRFISGGNILGDSVVASASNKIVGFQRNAGVRPSIPDINSIISSISSNIVNNVSNSINTNSQVLNKTVDGKIENFKTEFLQVIKNIENKINSISELSDNKVELINYINVKNVENKQNLLNEIKVIETKINSNKQELINYISKNNLVNKEQIIKLITEDKKEELIQLINENKRDIVNNKVEIIDYINTTILQSNLVKKIDQLETTISQVRNEVSQVQITTPPQQGFGGMTTQLRETVKNIRENVNETLNKTITSFTTSYRKKIEEVDTAKPTNILQKFIDAYNTAFGFAQFFGNRKNIGKLKENLNAIKESFTESFSTAKILRQVIVKIVKQLSNLPKASPSGGGGFDIDVDIPGPKMKQSLPRSARGMGKGKMLAMGAGALGLGAAGAATVNALADTGQVQPAAVQAMIPGDVVDQFSIIVDRFTNAVENLIKGATGNKKTQAMAKPSGGGSKAPSSAPPPGGSVVSSGTAGENIAAFTSTLEASGEQNQADVMQVMINRAAKNHSGYGDLFGQVTAREQFSPISAAIYIESADKDAQRIYGPIAAKLGKNPQERIATLKRISEGPQGLENLQKMFGKGDAAAANKVLSDFKSGGVLSQKSAKDVSGGLYFRGRSYSGGGVYLDRGSNKFIGGKGKGPATLSQVSSGTSAAPATSTIEPSKLTPSAKSSTAQAIAQPPPSQAEPQVNIMPIDMTGGQQQSASSSSLSPSPSKKTQGPSVPFLPSGNPDNFLLLYSKMVYNIVDG